MEYLQPSLSNYRERNAIKIQWHFPIIVFDNINLNAGSLNLWCKGPFFNYVEHILPQIDHLPTPSQGLSWEFETAGANY